MLRIAQLLNITQLTAPTAVPAGNWAAASATSAHMYAMIETTAADNFNHHFGDAARSTPCNDASIQECGNGLLSPGCVLFR
jgi:hypothetical protein